MTRSFHPPGRSGRDRLRACAVVLSSGALLAACTTFDPGRDITDARETATNRIGAAAGIDVSAHRQHLLAAPLSSNAAVALALAGNPGIDLALASLGLTAADAFAASRIANPQLSLSRLSGSGNERSVAFGLEFADLLLLSARSRLAQEDLDVARLETAAIMVDLARDTELAWYRHVAAKQTAVLYGALAEVVDAAADLAASLHRAGNLTDLELARKKAAAAEARTRATRAGAATAATRRDLNLLMGLSGEDAGRWQTPDRLPFPDGDEPDLDGLLSRSRNERLDLAAGRLQVSMLESGQNLERRWRWLGTVELDYQWERKRDGSRLRGPGLVLELPLFRQGQPRLLRAEAAVTRATAELALRELEVEHRVRSGHAELEALREILATNEDVIVPQRAAVVARELERYNFMLIGAFDLIAARAQEYQSYADFIAALRDYWLARTQLAHAIGGPLPTIATRPAPDLEGGTAGVDDADHDHHDHHHQGDAP